MFALIGAWFVENAASLFWDYGVPLIIAILRKTGFINWAEALGAKALLRLKDTKTYAEYPETEGQKAAEQLAPGTTNTNMVTGQKLEDDQAFPPHNRR